MRIATFAGALVFLTSQAAAAPPMDDTGFTAYVLERVKPHVPDGQELLDDKPMAVVLKARNGTRSVELETLRKVCQTKPAECDLRIDQFVDEWVSHFGPPPKPDLAKLHAVIWPDEGTGTFGEMSRSGNNLVGMRYAGDLWAVCINGSQPLTQSQFSDMGFKKADVVARCEQNTIAAQPPFDSYIADVPMHGIGKLSATNQATLLLAHDLWAPVAKRFDGVLIVCAPVDDTLYYAHGADSVTIDALTDRVKRDEADRVTANNLMGIKGDPRKIHVHILEWTESGWEVVP